MIRVRVELSHENDALARWELREASAALEGAVAEDPDGSAERVDLPDRTSAVALAGRLALARRVVVLWPESREDTIEQRLRTDLRPGDAVSFRPWGRGRSAPLGAPVRSWADAARGAGAAVDLTTPTRRFWYEGVSPGPLEFGEELAAVDRASFDARRMPQLPFRRPVSLPPRLGRVAANLARVRPGDRVADPFVGSGALALESALLGARVTGVDVDDTMVRGAIANFAHLSLTPESLVVGDAGGATSPGPFDAVVTDPPYGRASTTRGEAAADLVRRVLGHWAPKVRPGGRIVVVLPGGPDPLEAPWRRLGAVSDRVHRSLTREFRVYARDDSAPTTS